ncbi:MAG: hypothetical protein NDI94_07185 [Candidatus Woesearchaeota archaeon]|nr:hypothetical protein [Candidatus Woesearchaeota archaeon]
MPFNQRFGGYPILVPTENGEFHFGIAHVDSNGQTFFNSSPACTDFIGRHMGNVVPIKGEQPYRTLRDFVMRSPKTTDWLENETKVLTPGHEGLPIAITEKKVDNNYGGRRDIVRAGIYDIGKDGPVLIDHPHNDIIPFDFRQVAFKFLDAPALEQLYRAPMPDQDDLQLGMLQQYLQDGGHGGVIVINNSFNKGGPVTNYFDERAITGSFNTDDHRQNIQLDNHPLTINDLHRESHDRHDVYHNHSRRSSVDNHAVDNSVRGNSYW